MSEHNLFPGAGFSERPARLQAPPSSDPHRSPMLAAAARTHPIPTPPCGC